MYKSATKSRHNQHEYDLYADLEKIRDAFADTASDVKGKATDMISQSVDNVMQTSSHIQNNVAEYAAEKPFKTLGIAFAVGALCGYLMRK